MKKVTFITLEGLEGSGKSSVASFLKKYLEERNFSVVVFRDPGSTEVGERIRKILLDKNLYLTAYTELLLYLAARAQLIEEKLIKILEEETFDFVICDRFFDSTLAYQGYGLGMGKLVEKGIELFSPRRIIPDLTLILDTEVEKSLVRIKEKDRIESRPVEFHYLVRRGYIELSQRYPERIKLINANKSLPCIYQEIEKIIEALVCQR